MYKRNGKVVKTMRKGPDRIKCPVCGCEMKCVGRLDLDVYYLCESGHYIIHTPTGYIHRDTEKNKKEAIE